MMRTPCDRSSRQESLSIDIVSNPVGIVQSPAAHSHDTSLPPLPPLGATAAPNNEPSHKSTKRRCFEDAGLMIPFVHTNLMLLTLGVVVFNHSQHMSPPPASLIKETVAELLEGYDLPINKSKRRRAGDSSSKKKRVNYDRVRAHTCVMDDWLGPVPRFDDKQFVRTFRITKVKAQWIMNCLAKRDKFWTQTYDAIGNPSISPVVKFLTAQKRLAYGVAFSAFQDYFQMGESTARLCVSKFTR